MRPNTCNYLTDDHEEIKKSKNPKNYLIKRKVGFEDYKNCLKANQLEKEINFLEMNKLVVDSLRENYK